MAGKSVVHGQGESEALWMLGGLYEIRLSSDETDGTLTIMEMTVPEGAGRLLISTMATGQSTSWKERRPTTSVTS